MDGVGPDGPDCAPCRRGFEAPYYRPGRHAEAHGSGNGFEKRRGGPVMRILLSFLLLVCAAVFSQARAEDASPVASWTIIPKESVIDFEGTQMGAPFKGSFQSFEGTILFDP